MNYIKLFYPGGAIHTEPTDAISSPLVFLNEAIPLPIEYKQETYTPEIAPTDAISVQTVKLPEIKQLPKVAQHLRKLQLQYPELTEEQLQAKYDELSVLVQTNAQLTQGRTQKKTPHEEYQSQLKNKLIEVQEQAQIEADKKAKAMQESLAMLKFISPSTWVEVMGNADMTGAQELLADIFLDPTTYLSAGTIPLLKVATKESAEKILREAAERGLREGFENARKMANGLGDVLLKNAHNSGGVKMVERPSTLTEAERLGIPKGERNNNKRYGNLTFIRNIGLHDKPNYMPYMSDGKIKLSSDENLLVNLTTDIPFRTHLKYAYRPGGEIMIIDPKAFRGQTFLSLDPSDSMVLNKNLTVDPKHIQIITGNKDIAKTLSQSGITTYTSPKLQIEYKRAMQANPEIKMGKIRLDKKNFGDTPNEYTKAVDDFITKYIGRPDLGDYQKLQQVTNVNPHVIEFKDLISLLLLLLKLNTTKLKGSSDLADINLFTFPDKTSFTYYDIAVPSTINKTINTPYKNIFYNPFSSIEDDLMHSLGIGQHPKYSDEFQNILKQYILKNNIKPLKKQGGTINYLNLFEK